MEYQEIQNRVKEILPEKRYEHTLRVVEVAKHLAKVHGANEERATLAALVHDVCKPMDEVLMKKYVILHNLDVNLLDYPVEVLHGPVASAFIEEEFGVADEEDLYKVVEGDVFYKSINYEIMKSPIIEISSSLIRKNLKNKKSIKYMITDECRSYIEELSLYGISRNSK